MLKTVIFALVFAVTVSIIFIAYHSPHGVVCF